MKDDICTIDQKGVWSLADISVGRKFIATRWVYQAKRKENGHIERHKARLVAKRDSRKEEERI